MPWLQGSAYDGVYIVTELLKQTGDDQDADAFRECLCSITWSGAIGDDYDFDENGDVAGPSNVGIEVLPTGERTEDNLGYRVSGPASTPDLSQSPAMTTRSKRPYSGELRKIPYDQRDVD